MSKNANTKTWALSTAWDGNKYSEPANIPPPVVPVPPVLSVATTTSNSHLINISGGSGATSWVFDYKQNSSPAWIVYSTPAVGTSNINVGSLLANTSYDYKIIATNGAGSNTSTILTASTYSTPSGQLATGHFFPQKMAMTAVFPRPDSETGTYSGNTAIARNRWAYYDGVNTVPFEMPIAVQGGSRPLIYSILSGPPGMNVGATYGSTNYGVVTWTPNAAISPNSPTTCSVLVTGQDGNTLTITWTIATSSSTNQFLFMSPTGNDSTGTGTISNPFQSFVPLWGATDTTTTYPGRTVYIRGGSYSFYLRGPFTISDYNGCSALRGDYCPTRYLAFPGETVNIDGTTAQIRVGSTSSDLFFGGSSTSRMVINGSSTAALETHGFRMQGSSNRCTWWNIDFTNPVSRTHSNITNSTSILHDNSAIASYYACIGCTETGRTFDSANTTGPENSMLLNCWFSTTYAITEFCTASGQSSSGLCYKDSNIYSTIAFNKIDAQGLSGGNGIIFAGQLNTQSNEFGEICYNFVRGGGILFNSQGFANTANNVNGPMWSYRNTVLRTDTNDQWGVGGWMSTLQGPYSSESDVIACKGPLIIKTNTNFTASNTELEYSRGSAGYTTGGIFDSNTGFLTGTSRTNYLGTRGFEIA